MAKLGVITCFYNDEIYLEQLWECLRNISESNVNFYFIDDHSNDDSFQTIKRATKGFNNVKVIQAPNDCKGPGASRNYVLDRISDNYVCFLDADDFVGNDYYREILDISMSLNLDLMRTDWTVANGRSRTLIKYEQNIPLNKILEGQEYFGPYDKSTAFDRAAGCCGIYNKKFIDKYNIRFSNCITAEDRYFVFKCLFFAKRCMVRSFENGYFYRQEDNNIRLTKIGDKKQNEFFIVMQEIIDFCLSNNVKNPIIWRKLIHQSVALFNLHYNRRYRLTKAAYLDLWCKASKLMIKLKNCPEFDYVVSRVSAERKLFVQKLLKGEFIYE